MFNMIFRLFQKEELVCKGLKQISKSRHHRKAIADGLRRGSSEAAKIMAKWRWKKP